MGSMPQVLIWLFMMSTAAVALRPRVAPAPLQSRASVVDLGASAVDLGAPAVDERLQEPPRVGAGVSEGGVVDGRVVLGGTTVLEPGRSRYGRRTARLADVIVEERATDEGSCRASLRVWVGGHFMADGSSLVS